MEKSINRDVSPQSCVDTHCRTSASLFQSDTCLSPGGTSTHLRSSTPMIDGLARCGTHICQTCFGTITMLTNGNEWCEWLLMSCLRDTCKSCLSFDDAIDAVVSRCILADWILRAVDAVCLPLNSSLWARKKLRAQVGHTQTQNLIRCRGTRAPQGPLTQDNPKEDSYKDAPSRDQRCGVWGWGAGRQRFLRCRTQRRVHPQSGQPMSEGLLTTGRSM